MRFIADGMLGKLARWLRLAGHDVIYIGDLRVPSNEQDRFLVLRAKKEKRALLTCDIGLHRNANRAGIKSVFIETNDVIDQLVEVSKRCGRMIRIRPEGSRCPMCNGILELAGKSEVVGKIPDEVVKMHREFWRCGDCGKIYWHGKHWKTILRMASEYERKIK